MSPHDIKLSSLYKMPRHVTTKDGAIYQLEDGSQVNIPQKYVDYAKKRQKLYQQQQKKKQ